MRTSHKSLHYFQFCANVFDLNRQHCLDIGYWMEKLLSSNIHGVYIYTSVHSNSHPPEIAHWKLSTVVWTDQDKVLPTPWIPWWVIFYCPSKEGHEQHTTPIVVIGGNSIVWDLGLYQHSKSMDKSGLYISVATTEIFPNIHC